MKKTILIALCLVLSTAAWSQVRVSGLNIISDGTTTEVSFDAAVDNKATRRNYKLIVTPVLYSVDKAVSLSPIVVETRRTRIMDFRNRVKAIPGATLTENGKTVNYKALVNAVDLPSEPDLRLEMTSVGCCSEKTLEPVIVTTAPEPASPRLMHVAPPQPQPQQPAPGSQQVQQHKPASMRIVTGRETVGFAQGSSRLDLWLFDNHIALDNIVASLRALDPQTLQGRRIEIVGCASPEGGRGLNYTLAHKRAIALRNYILDHVRLLRPADFYIINGGENWEGLYKLVEESTIPGRWQVLDILERPYIDDTIRKRMLMAIDGGRTWRFMEARFFPRLRGAASITIYAVPESEPEATPEN